MAKKTKTEATPVLTSDQDFISSAIGRYGVTDSAIQKIRDKYSGLSIAGPDDKENYKLVQAGIAELRGLRTKVEETRKDLKQVALDYGRAVDGEAKRITTALQSIEEPLKAERERVDKEIEEIKQADYLRKVRLLTDAGFQFDGRCYIAGSVLVHANKLDQITDEELIPFIESGKAELAAAEERRKKERESQKQTERQNRLFRMGLRFDGSQFVYQDINFHWTDLLVMTDQEFDSIAVKAEARMKVILQQEEAERKQAEASRETVQAQPSPAVNGTPKPKPVSFENIFDPEDEPSEPEIQSVSFSEDFISGFNSCREAVIRLLDNPIGSKAAFISSINALIPGGDQ